MKHVLWSMCSMAHICDPSLYLDFSWKVHGDLCGSDHFPIVIRSEGAVPSVTNSTWKLSKADWDTFSEKAASDLKADCIINAADPVGNFTDVLCSIANSTIPKSKTKPVKHNTIWLNDECKEVIKCRKKAQRKLNIHPTAANIENYRIIRAKARRTIKARKRESWRKYVSSINNRTSIKKVWTMVRKISGKYSNTKIHHLDVNGDEVTDIPDIADSLAQTFSQNSSVQQCTQKFDSYRRQAENNRLSFKSKNLEAYNNSFSMDELTSAISKSRDSAVGPDDIHYQMLKHLPGAALETLLHLLNDIWISGNFPESWRTSTIIPVLKAGKDESDPSSYRPIALTSCICKIMERMINDRLVWYLEKHKLLTPVQCGFRKNRSTTDHLVRLETFVREAFIQRQHAVVVFFDLERAYDTTWKYGIMRDLHRAGLRGRLPTFIEGFLQNRNFQVRIDSCLSQHLTCWPRHMRYPILCQYCLVVMYKLTRTSHTCGQQLPSVQINFNAAS